MFCVSLSDSVCTFSACGVYALHSRYANLKQVVLDELLAQHSDAQLDTQLHEAAGMGTLEGEEVNRCRRGKSSVWWPSAEVWRYGGMEGGWERGREFEELTVGSEK